LATFVRTLGYLVRRCHQAHNVIFAELTDGHNITSPQWAALRAIDAYPGLDQATLSDVIAYDRATIGGLVDRLELKGLVRRSVGADRRAKQLNLTEGGHALIDAAGPMLAKLPERLLERLDPEERTTFIRLLERILNIEETVTV
jgi:DNA-binding MarR family transcriptional regulator